MPAVRDLPMRERPVKTEREGPSATLQVSRIPPSVTEERLEAVAWELAVGAGSSMPNAVRFEYEHDRFSGTALVEFPHKDAAKMFKEHVGSSLDVDGVQLDIRYQKQTGEKSRSRSREHADRDDPSVTLIVKGIASTTREDAVTGSFAAYAQIKDVRHFARRGFAFVQFHSVEDAIRALNRFEKEARSRIDGQRVTANFAKEREEPFREGRNFLVAERNFLQKQAIATAEVTAEIEKLQQQQIQHENTSKALSGVNGSMWANYMQSVAQTETVQSSNSFKYDKESGFYKDAKAQLYYDPNTTYFFTLDYKKYFVYDADKQLLCLVDAKGQRVPRGETRPLPSQVAANATAGRQPERARSRSRRRSRSPVRERERARSKTEPTKAAESKRPAEKEPSMRSEPAAAEELRHQPIHFPGGDPLAKLAPSPPEAAKPTPQPKKKKKAPESVLGLAAPPEQLQKPGPVTVFGAARPGPVTLLAPAPRPAPEQPVALPAAPVVPAVPVPAVQPAPAVMDWICEVCMRKFSSEEALRRHEQLSELHKQNLEKLGLAA